MPIHQVLFSGDRDFIHAWPTCWSFIPCLSRHHSPETPRNQEINISAQLRHQRMSGQCLRQGQGQEEGRLKMGAIINGSMGLKWHKRYIVNLPGTRPVKTRSVMKTFLFTCPPDLLEIWQPSLSPTKTCGLDLSNAIENYGIWFVIHNLISYKSY